MSHRVKTRTLCIYWLAFFLNRTSRFRPSLRSLNLDSRRHADISQAPVGVGDYIAFIRLRRDMKCYMSDLARPEHMKRNIGVFSA